MYDAYGLQSLTFVHNLDSCIVMAHMSALPKGQAQL
jgi:hypothetical protein